MLTPDAVQDEIDKLKGQVEALTQVSLVCLGYIVQFHGNQRTHAIRQIVTQLETLAMTPEDAGLLVQHPSLGKGFTEIFLQVIKHLREHSV